MPCRADDLSCSAGDVFYRTGNLSCSPGGTSSRTGCISCSPASTSCRIAVASRPAVRTARPLAGTSYGPASTVSWSPAGLLALPAGHSPPSGIPVSLGGQCSFSSSVSPLAWGAEGDDVFSWISHWGRFPRSQQLCLGRQNLSFHGLAPDSGGHVSGFFYLSVIRKWPSVQKYA